MVEKKENEEKTETRFKYFNHTADVKFQAFGKTLEEAYSNAVLATTNVITDVDKIKQVKEFNVEIDARRRESLLFDMLNEVIFFLDTQKVLISAVKDIEILESPGKVFLRCKFMGDDLENYKVNGDIKSATYNLMTIKEKEGKFTVQAVLDL